MDALLNIDDIISPEQSTRVKVLVLWPSGKTDIRVPDRKENINLLKNIALKNWTLLLTPYCHIQNYDKIF